MNANFVLVRMLVALAAGLAATAGAQLLPTLPRVDRVEGMVRPLTQVADGITGNTVRALTDARADRVAAMVRAYPDRIALDPDGFPARAGELVVSDPPAGLVATATARGFRVLEEGELIGVGFVRFAVPPGRRLSRAIRDLREFGAREVAADQLHSESGLAAAAGAPAAGTGPRIGLIDGGVAGLVAQRGFAVGAPRASDHGTAVASLIAGAQGIRGAAPGAQVVAADVYGSDPAGGNASAIARALAWLVTERIAVVNISLVGPRNPLLERVVAAAQARGTLIVAPVGNDGPAAPPGYPASYPGVIAVTGVDGRNRILIEAGRARHLDYAAPGADMLATRAGGGLRPVRGTSFAAPLVAGTLALTYRAPKPGGRAQALSMVDAGARRLGARYGRGLVCGDCRTAAR